MSTVLNSILEVFTAMSAWFGTAFDNIIPIFWTEAASGGTGSLTFVGTLVVIGTAFAVALLLIRYIINFTRLGN